MNHPTEPSDEMDERLDRAVSLVRRMRAQHHRTGSYAAGHLIAEVDDFLSTIPPPTPTPENPA